MFPGRWGSCLDGTVAFGTFPRMQVTHHALVEAANRALAELPQPLRAALAQAVILVEDWPDAETLRALDLTDPGMLLGVFEGEGLPWQEAAPPTGKLPERIRLFAGPLRRHCAATGESLEEAVRATLWHEIGHFFGFSDEELASLGL